MTRQPSAPNTNRPHRSIFASAVSAFRGCGALGIGLTLLLVACTMVSVVGEARAETDPAGTGSLRGTGFPGAAAIRDHRVPLQQVAKAIRPSLGKAREDKGRSTYDGCLVAPSKVRSPVCTYGDASSSKTVVLFGDSKAAQYFAALEPLALRRGWKLVVLTKSICSVGKIEFSSSCDRWRRASLDRIRELEQPDLVVVATSTLYVMRLGGTAAVRDRLATSLSKTLKYLKGLGSRVVLIRDASRLPRDPATCVRGHRKDLRRCAFRPEDRSYKAYDLAAARRSRVRVIDLQGHVCRPTLCPLVIGNVLAYRNKGHYSSTFLATTAPWLAKKLPPVR